MYRQQFLDYLDRYDEVEPRDQSQVPQSTLRPTLETEWFRKPPTSNLSPNSSFSTFSQSSATFESSCERGQTRREGESYLSTPCVNREGFNLLKWWCTNQAFFPQLAQVAKDVLAVPITQVGVERVFNTARDVIGDRRHRLSAQTTRKIMILKDSICQGQSQEEELLPADEVDDLLELPAGSDFDSGNETEEDTRDELLVPPVILRALVAPARENSARVRRRPARFNDSVLL